MPGANTDLLETLSERERQCLRLVFERLRPKEIGRELGISHHTVNGHLQQAMRKLGASSSIEAARQLHEASGSTAESITGYVFGVESTGDPAMLPVSKQGGSDAGRVQDSMAGGLWGRGAMPFPPPSPRFRWPLPVRGEIRNDLTPVERLFWIAAGIVAVAIIGFMGAAAVESIQRTLQAATYHIN